MSTSSDPSNTPALLALLSTTVSLTHSFTSTLVFRSYMRSASSTVKPPPSTTNASTIARALSLYWRTALPSTLIITLTLTLTSLISGIRTFRSLSPLTLANLRPTTQTQRYVALAGTSLATIGQLMLGAKMLDAARGMAYAYERVGDWLVDSVTTGTEASKVEDAEELGMTREEAVDEEVLERQGDWMTLSKWRMGVAEAPAWLCFAWLVFSR